MREILKRQSKAYPNMEPVDLLKLCYQAEFGCGHLFQQSDYARVRAFLYTEFADIEADAGAALFEEVGGSFVRMNLSAAKAAGISEELIFHMLITSAANCGSEAGLRRRLQDALALTAEGAFAFGSEAFETCVHAYDFEKRDPVSHSEGYRAAYHPAYRVIDRKLVRLMPLLRELERRRGRQTVLAIDGRAAAGKSTAAELIAQIFGSAVIHADDFFLPFDLRTPERMAEIGGNIHYERFVTEVLPHLGSGEFDYGVFDCSRGVIVGRRTVPAARLRIVEGSYSLHPRFGGYADIRVFFDISPAEQKDRILARNGDIMWRSFDEKWIPMEERYFQETALRARCDFVL